MLGSRGDCSPRCRPSPRHSAELVAALSLPLPEEAVVAWVARHCHAPARARDGSGRSLLHAAASRGQLRVLKVT